MTARKKVPVARGSPAAPRAARARRYVLKLYVAGMTERSVAAIRTTTRFCDEHLPGRYQLAIIDVHQQPGIARSQRIIAVPTLVRERPLPEKRIMGTLEKLDGILTALAGRHMA